MSEFIFLYRNSPAAREAAMGTPEQRQKSMQRWMNWMRELESKGHLKSAGQPLDRSVKMVRGGIRAPSPTGPSWRRRMSSAAFPSSKPKTSPRPRSSPKDVRDWTTPRAPSRSGRC